MAKKDPVRWNSTKKQDAENARLREIKNEVFTGTQPLTAELAATVLSVRSLRDKVDSLGETVATILRGEFGQPNRPNVVRQIRNDPPAPRKLILYIDRTIHDLRDAKLKIEREIADVEREKAAGPQSDQEVVLSVSHVFGGQR